MNEALKRNLTEEEALHYDVLTRRDQVERLLQQSFYRGYEAGQDDLWHEWEVNE